MRKQPGQRRSRATVEYILEAASQVFRDRGYDRGSTNRIALRAGVSIGSLYQYFPNKEAILLWAIERQVRRNVSRVVRVLDDARRAGKPGLETIRELTRMTMREHLKFARARREVLRSVPRVADQVHETVRPLLEPTIEAGARLLEAAPDVEVADPHLAAVFIVETLHERAHWFVEHGQERGIDPDAYTEELVRMMERYVTGG